jgi:tetratricopeptide (TPR) repeat protein
MIASMRTDFTFLIRTTALAALLCTALPHRLSATGAELTDPEVDPGACVAAVSAGDADNVIKVCGALAENEKTARADRVKALIARAAAYERKDQIDRAIGDYDTVLRLDPALADVCNVRGELWRRKGDLPRALADFETAIKLNPQHEAARANHKSLAHEVERIGAQMAIKKPSPPLK